MRAAVALLLLGALAGAPTASADDVVWLRNGGRLRGQVYGNDPAQGVWIQFADGTRRAVPPAEVLRVDYRALPGPSGPARDAAPAPAYPPQGRVESPDERARREADAIRQAEELRRAQEAQRLAAEVAQRGAAEEAQRRAVEEAQRRAVEEAQRRAVEEAQRRAVEEAQRRAAEEAEQERREREAELTRTLALRSRPRLVVLVFGGLLEDENVDVEPDRSSLVSRQPGAPAIVDPNIDALEVGRVIGPVFGLSVSLRIGLGAWFELQTRLGGLVRPPSASTCFYTPDAGPGGSGGVCSDGEILTLGGTLEATVRLRVGSPLSPFYVGAGPSFGLLLHSGSVRMAEYYPASGGTRLASFRPFTIDLSGVGIQLHGLAETGFVFGPDEEWEAGARLSIGLSADPGDLRYGGLMLTGTFGRALF